MTESPTYPNRPSYFAVRFIRLLVKSCAGARIGPDGCWLLATIVSTEDAKRYSGPVTFFGGNLADQLGVSVSTMQRAREKCVEAGWLHHAEGAKGRAATYWVIIPPGEEGKPDGPSDETSSDLLGQMLSQVDQASGQQEGRIRPSKRSASGQHVTNTLPIPIPSPEEEEGANRSGSLPATGEGKTKTKKSSAVKADASTEPIPEKLDTPAFREVWADWLAHRTKLRKPMTAFAARLQFRKLLKLDPSKAVACVEKSIASGWSDVFEEKFLPGGQFDNRPPGNPHPGYDLPSGPVIAPPMVLNGKAGVL